MEKLVLAEVKDRIGWVTLNRPEKRNAMSPELIASLSGVLDEFAANTEVKVVVLKAEGKAFCAGADLDYIRQLQNFNYKQNLEDSQKLLELFSNIYEYPKPVIAQVQGHALAGGCGLVTVCDFAFSAPESLFGYTEVKIGFIPALVSVFLAEQIGQAKATELLLSGELISAQKAAELGLISQVVLEDSLGKFTEDFAQKLIESNSGLAMKETKRLLRSLGKKQRDEALNAAAEANAKARASEDCVQGIAAFLSKTKPNW
ncbi:enoyl-CoA hydratase/isomerase family protein [Algoriphagus confluentis]|uniref:Enoyl-CoA hydratase-related protein n=1 Tax=Algoriphagus confluentis TaxID=1697556 RepID=A0ABQ6PQU6_9BACT|nr:enoyl-CoA hydratase-related protein [Algoriphagus confluentis]